MNAIESQDQQVEDNRREKRLDTQNEREWLQQLENLYQQVNALDVALYGGNNEVQRILRVPLFIRTFAVTYALPQPVERQYQGTN